MDDLEKSIPYYPIQDISMDKITDIFKLWYVNTNSSILIRNSPIIKAIKKATI